VCVHRSLLGGIVALNVDPSPLAVWGLCWMGSEASSVWDDLDRAFLLQSSIGRPPFCALAYIARTFAIVVAGHSFGLNEGISSMNLG